jgi:U5 small nuclear ribonucleoprotein component
MFTLSSFAQVYADHNDDSLGNISIEEFGKRLWGDWYWDEETKKFYGSPKYCSSPRVERSFVAFCLEPLYKIYTACLGEQEENANKLLRSLGILLKKEQLRSSARPLLRAALSKFFETATCGFVDMIVQHT